MQLVKTRMHLLKMPFDKYEDGVGFIHATGDWCQFEDGHWQMEYEDDVFDDAPDCEYIIEEEEEPEEYKDDYEYLNVFDELEESKTIETEENQDKNTNIER